MRSVLRQVVDKVGWITLNRPQQTNAVTVTLARELENAIVMAAGDPAVNIVVIRGAGGTFCAGVDSNELERLRSGGPAALRPLLTAFRNACDAIGRVKVPVVAAVEGIAIGAGFELMQSADVVVVADEAQIAAGLIPSGGTERLGRLVGRQQALGMLLSGDRISGADAAGLGLAYRCFPQVEFDESVRRFVADLAAQPRESAMAVKRLVYTSQGTSPSDGLDDEIGSVVAHICGTAARAGVAAVNQQGARR